MNFKVPQPEYRPSKQNKPKLAKETPRKFKKCVFSFQYFEQKENFGFSQSNTSWFVSLLNRLTELSKIEFESIRTDQNIQNGLRYHKIDWQAKNIPIQRHHLTQLDKKYQENADEYDIVQIHISKGKGRIIGLWDENSVFQILLLDPLHNLQPCKIHSYKIRPCTPVKDNLDTLVSSIESIISKQDCLPNCRVQAKLGSIMTKVNSSEHGIFIHTLEESEIARCEQSLNEGYTLTDIMQLGIAAIHDDSTKPTF